MEPAIFGIGDDQFLHGASNTDVGQAPLLLESARLFKRHLMRKEVFLHASNKHQRKLEALRRMQRHHLDAVLVRVSLTLSRIECRTIQKRLKR